MKIITLLYTASAATIGVGFADTTCTTARDILATTNQGLIRGVEINALVDAFLGVPFAQPPLGNLRFQPPQPLPTAATGVTTVAQNSSSTDAYSLPKNASAPGPVCHQFRYRTVMGDALKAKTNESEDCLTLNVYVPAATRKQNPHKTLAVYAWSYGGAFGEGGASVPIFDPSAFVAENKDIIVVTWNYRLNIFGFPNTPALNHQNLGLRDQRAALEWVRDNIAGFGGDPSRIVLGGQSAGAGSAHAMLYSHAEDPIVSAVLLQSGAAQIIGAAEKGADAEFVRVARAVGCANAKDRDRELRCMQSVDADRLKHAVSNTTLNRFGSPPGGAPMVDNVTMFTQKEYARRGAEGSFARVPTLMGMLTHEVDAVLNWDANKGINQSISRIVTETVFECNMQLESGFRAANNVPVWRYLWKGIFPDVTTFPWLRAYHKSDVPILMGTYSIMASPNRTSPTTPWASRFIQRLFGDFIRDPARALHNKYHMPTYQPNTTSLVELLPKGSEPGFRLGSATENPACKNPTPVPWDQL